jgi:hypothetical protein
MKRKLSLFVAALMAMGAMVLSPVSAQASVAYSIQTCYAGSGTAFTVSSWYDAALGKKVYHYRASAKGYTSSFTSYSTRTVYWNGISLLDNGSSLVIEGYRYSSYQGRTPWKAEFQRYTLGVPTGTTSCSMSR